MAKPSAQPKPSLRQSPRVEDAITLLAEVGCNADYLRAFCHSLSDWGMRVETLEQLDQLEADAERLANALSALYASYQGAGLTLGNTELASRLRELPQRLQEAAAVIRSVRARTKSARSNLSLHEVDARLVLISYVTAVCGRPHDPLVAQLLSALEGPTLSPDALKKFRRRPRHADLLRSATEDMRARLHADSVTSVGTWLRRYI
jgi:predicted secreted protein